MKSRIIPSRSGLRVLGLGIALALVPAAATFASSDPSDPDLARQQAVPSYEKGATRELEAYRQQLNALARPDNQQQLRDAKAKLDECSSLVADLKTTDQAHFDLVKESYERARSELVKALQATQKT